MIEFPLKQRMKGFPGMYNDFQTCNDIDDLKTMLTMYAS